jgi:hypothetical protein
MLNADDVYNKYKVIIFKETKTIKTYKEIINDIIK